MLPIHQTDQINPDSLVSLRNELVHHLIEKFDIGSDEGCKSAIEHLVSSYERIDKHFGELREWVQSMEQAREAMAALAQSDAFHNLMVNGIAPDGTIKWPYAGIVSVLREGIAFAEADGWALLDVVRDWAGENHPEQTPEMYSCQSWPQVIHESKQFELNYRADVTGKKSAWIRERPPKLSS